MNITVDGCDYRVIESSSSNGCITTDVIDINDDLIAVGWLDHNSESAGVTYYFDAGWSQEGVYLYWNYTTAEEFARWAVSTHPING